MSGIILILILFFGFTLQKNDRMACIKIELTER